MVFKKKSEEPETKKLKLPKAFMQDDIVDAVSEENEDIEEESNEEENEVEQENLPDDQYNQYLKMERARIDKELARNELAVAEVNKKTKSLANIDERRIVEMEEAIDDLQKYVKALWNEVYKK